MSKARHYSPTLSFTGTRKGITLRQSATLSSQAEALTASSKLVKLHHGDCLGADLAMHRIARELGWFVVIHPPTNTSERGYCDGDERRPPQDYIERNHQLVREGDFLWAVPEGPERLRSGTWATVRHARKLGRGVVIFWPSGNVTIEEATKP
jgi:hypothetical protein